jgi:hypothetical protein
LGNNEGLTRWVKSYGIEKVELSIYYDIAKELIWLAHEHEKAIKYFANKGRSKSANQINLFYSLAKNNEDSYFLDFPGWKYLCI